MIVDILDSQIFWFFGIILFLTYGVLAKFFPEEILRFSGNKFENEEIKIKKLKEIKRLSTIILLIAIAHILFKIFEMTS